MSEKQPGQSTIPHSTLQASDGRKRNKHVVFAITALSAVLCFTVIRLVPLTTVTDWVKFPTFHDTGLSEQDRPSLSYEDIARQILQENPLVDGHNDLAVRIRLTFQNHVYDSKFKDAFEGGRMPGHTDLKKIDQGGYGGAFWSAFWLCPDDIFDFSDEAYDPIIRATLQQLDLYHRLGNEYPEYFPITLNASAARTDFQKHRKLISPLAIEGLHQIGNSMSNLRLYYSLGVRYATLTWNCHNQYADASALTWLKKGVTKPSTPYWGGINPDKGRVLIKEMNRLGMIVDLAHVSPDTMRDVLLGEHKGKVEWSGTLAPPIISHSSVFSICPHPRNVPDSILPLIKHRDSVVMINFNPDFIACHYPDGSDPTKELPETDKEEATLDKVVEHIMYIGNKIGYDHVGIGSDFDGIETTPRGLESVAKLPDLVAELLRKGVQKDDIVKVVGGNVLRVWDEVDKTSMKLQKQGVLPAEDDPEKMDVGGLLKEDEFLGHKNPDD